MLHLIYAYVASVLSRCCNAHAHMLQVYVVNVSSVLDVCCSKCFILQVFHKQARQGGAGEGGPLGHSGPRTRARKRTGRVAVGAEHKAVSMDLATSAEHEAASMVVQQARSMKLHPWASSRRRGRGEAENKVTSIGALRVSLLKTDGQQERAFEQTHRPDVQALVSSLSYRTRYMYVAPRSYIFFH
jgi:hypothetical protein